MIPDYHARYYAHEFSIRSASDGVDRLFQSLFGGKIDLNSHQIGEALFALMNLLSKDVIVVNSH